MHPIWNPPAGAEAIDSIFALYDGEETVPERHAPKAPAMEPGKNVMTYEDAALNNGLND